jgi:hypothetical protein
VHLLDRTIQIGEFVHSIDQPNRIGHVTDIKLTVDLVTLPNQTHVITDVNAERLVPVNVSIELITHVN